MKSIKIAAFALLVGVASQGASVLQANERESINENRTSSNREVLGHAGRNNSVESRDSSSFSRNLRGVSTINYSEAQQGNDKSHASRSNRDLSVKKKDIGRETENQSSNGSVR